MVGLVAGTVGLNAFQALLTDGAWLSLRVRLSDRVKAWWSSSRNTTVKLLPIAASTKTGNTKMNFERTNEDNQ